MAKALDFIHGEGILHCDADVKAENVMLANNEGGLTVIQGMLTVDVFSTNTASLSL
jgi:hypothetical protein